MQCDCPAGAHAHFSHVCIRTSVTCTGGHVHSRQAEKERKKTADQEAAGEDEDDHMDGMSETGIDEDDKPRARWKTWHFWKKILPIVFSLIMFVAGMLLLVIGDSVV